MMYENLDTLIISFEMTLFIVGFLYGLFAGNDKMNMLVRAFCGGLFFATFYISIPLTLIYEKTLR